jgi:hypothetical protein
MKGNTKTKLRDLGSPKSDTFDKEIQRNSKIYEGNICPNCISILTFLNKLLAEIGSVGAIPFWQFMALETAPFWWCLVPDSGAITCQNGAVSGTRNAQYMAISGSFLKISVFLFHLALDNI